MSKLAYLNLGCGYHFNPSWVNVDFTSTGENVIAYNLLKGIPFPDNSFEVVYHSHVLEHFSKLDGEKFLSECFRVLKPNGILRIAIPDLEQIVNNYTRLLDVGKKNINDRKNYDDYEWIMIEMYDQTVRNKSGGEMITYLAKEILNNEKFVFDRIGHEGIMIRNGMLNKNTPPVEYEYPPFKSRAYNAIKRRISNSNLKNVFFRTFFKNEYRLLQLANFRLSGEIHQWMYDIYSISWILKDIGFRNIEKKEFDNSLIPSWRTYSLDEVDSKVRKPDSLFVEAIKK